MRHRLGIVALLLVAGCAHFEPQPLSPEGSATQLYSRGFDDPGLKQFLEKTMGHKLADWPETNWDLPKLTLVAYYYHPSLEVARAQWLVALAGVRTAGARPNPSVTVNPGYDTQIPGNFSPWLVPVSFDVPIETAGKRAKRIAEAEKNAESARWSLISALWQVRSGVRDHLADYVLAGRQVEILQSESTNQQAAAKLMQQRLDLGEISRPELTTAAIALNKTKSDLSDARSKQAEAHARLAEALGVSEAALDGENPTFDLATGDASQLRTAEARNVALRSRADILTALADYAAEEDDLRLEVARQYPDLHLGPGYAWNNGNAGDNQWSLGLTLELPLLDQNQGPIAEAEARRKLAAAKFVSLQAQVIGEIDRALAEFRVAALQYQAGNQSLAAQRQQEESAQAEMAAGAADQLDLLGARLELSNAMLAQLDSQAKLQSAYAALEDAIQWPSEDFTLAIKYVTAGITNR